MAMNKGFIVNLETRRGQPGRYRLTDQKIEAEELLPSPEALGQGPRNPCNRATGRTTVKYLKNLAIAPRVARLRRFQRRKLPLRNALPVLSMTATSAERKPKLRPLSITPSYPLSSTSAANVHRSQRGYDTPWHRSTMRPSRTPIPARVAANANRPQSLVLR